MPVSQGNNQIYTTKFELEYIIHFFLQQPGVNELKTEWMKTCCLKLWHLLQLSIYCGQVRPYMAEEDLGQHWLKQWHPAIS